MAVRLDKEKLREALEIPPLEGRVADLEQTTALLQKIRRKHSVVIIKRPFPKTTTTSTTYVEFDDNTLIVKMPEWMNGKTRVYASYFIVGRDLGVALNRTYLTTAETWDSVHLEERSWTGSQNHNFYYHDITDLLCYHHQLVIRPFILTTAVEAVLSRGSYSMLIVDFGEW